jgi:hypothetical protein
MSLGSGKHWITPTARTSRVTGVTVKDGKVTVKPKRVAGKPRRVMEARAKREERQWRARATTKGNP